MKFPMLLSKQSKKKRTVMNEPELLFSQVLNCDRASLYLNKDLFLDRNQSLWISSVLKKRIYGEPIQYILGETEFMGLDFKINKDVFIPRPETEVLVETALAYAKRLSSGAKRILELGTGSGCIAISLAKFWPQAKITAIDISDQALKIARVNADSNGVNINFLHGDLFAVHHLTPATYGLIVSNPPYIPSAEIENLQPEVRHEPEVALDGGSDGLDFFRKIITQAPKYLTAGGLLIMEMGFNQCGAISEILENTKDLDLIEIIQDYNNIDRVIVIKRKRQNG